MNIKAASAILAISVIPAAFAAQPVRSDCDVQGGFAKFAIDAKLRGWSQNKLIMAAAAVSDEIPRDDFEFIWRFLLKYYNSDYTDPNKAQQDAYNACIEEKIK